MGASRQNRFRACVGVGGSRFSKRRIDHWELADRASCPAELQSEARERQGALAVER